MYHFRDGWYFGREEDGTVLVKHQAPSVDLPSFLLNIPVDAWASIVAAVSQYGDTKESWEKARDFHNGEGAGPYSPKFDNVLKLLEEAYEAWTANRSETHGVLSELMLAYDDWLD